MSRPFDLTHVGAHPCAVFETFVIPASSLYEAERRGNLAVALGATRQATVESQRKGILLDYAKAIAAIEKQRDDTKKFKETR